MNDNLLALCRMKNKSEMSFNQRSTISFLYILYKTSTCFLFIITLAASEGANQAQGWQGGQHHFEPHDERAADRLVQSRLRLESYEGNFEPINQVSTHGD